MYRVLRSAMYLTHLGAQMVDSPGLFDQQSIELRRDVVGVDEQGIDRLMFSGFSSGPNSNKKSTYDMLCFTQIHHKRESYQHLQEFVNSPPKVTNCAAIPLATKLSISKHLLKFLINKLFIPREDEKEKLEDINRDVQNAIHRYVALVDNTKRKINLATPSLKSSIEDIQDLLCILSLNTGDRKEHIEDLRCILSLNTGDRKEDIKIAFESITFDPAKLLEIVEASRNESDDLDKQIRNIQQDILNQQRVKQQLQLGYLFPVMGAVGGFLGGYAARTLVDSVYFGGHGKLVINVSLFVRNKIIATTTMGAFMFGLIGYVFINFWKKEPTKALGDLNSLSYDNWDFKNHIKAFETAVSEGENEMKRIKSTIKGDSKGFIFKSHMLLFDLTRSLFSIDSSTDKINGIDVKKWKAKSNKIE